MLTFSAEELCRKYPKKYIAVRRIAKDNLQILRVYNTLDDCKKSAKELKEFMSLYKEDFDVIYGDYEDYISTRFEKSAFNMLGTIAFELFGLDALGYF